MDKIIMNDYVEFGKNKIYFSIELKKRKTLEISVHPDLRVVVKAPLNIKIEKIKGRVKKKSNWILKHLSYFKEMKDRYSNIAERRYISGETHYYLGRQYRLKIINAAEEKVKFNRGYIYIYVNNENDTERKKYLLDNWYKKRAEIKFKERLNICYKKFKKYKIKMPEIRIKKMRTRWGSCSRKGRISLNIDLIKLPISSIDYVITHELCHFKFHNHNKHFYNFLSMIMPDWQKIRGRCLTF